MFSFLNHFFDSNDKEIKKVSPIINKINDLEESVKKLKDKDFPKKTEEFKKRLTNGESTDDILPESFALVREAARRTLGLRHFDVQLVSAYVLSYGKIAEQKTGEGKTLSATPALYLNSLNGNGVHLVTVNDYLARRDAGWMGPLFHLLGVSVASIINDQSFLYDPTFEENVEGDERLAHLRPISRKEAYEQDIVYGINSEFGFDYLRDNMQQDFSRVVQRGFHYAIVDEVDSVLIDEARTPHIISAPDEAPSQKYYEYAGVVQKLSSDTDYKLDEKMRTVHLTDHGIGKLEKLYGIKDIYEKDFDTVYHIEAALKARTLFHREKDYIVKDGEVILVDEFTGRLMPGRRLSEGIHQAIEAKETVSIQRESKTLATVSLQNYFRMYEKLAGMTGTAVTESEEFHKIYNLDVVAIPTNNPMVRIDESDAVYKSARAKFSAVVAEIAEVHKTGQPMLVGTTSIEKNEIISELLKRKGIKHEVLNAKNHLREAQIIAKAGQKDAVTVATNMAGRGVDIILGGEPPSADDSAKQNQERWEKAHKDVVKLGGLYVIGTERHESRRIDNQLRGRSGRQGDPGRSQFFVSLDDDIMRLFGGDRIAGLMTRFNMPEDVPLTHPLVSRAIEHAQVKVEGFNFDIRKHLVEYDDVLNKQREIIYGERRKILETASVEDGTLKEDILARIDSYLTSLTTLHTAGLDVDDPDQKIIEEYVTAVPFDEKSQKNLHKQLQNLPTVEEKASFLISLTTDLYKKREETLGKDVMSQIEQFVTLSVIDNLWMSHLDAMDNLRQGIGLRGYAQKDPLVEYKNEGFRMFEQLMGAIDDEIVHRIFRVQVHQSPDSKQQHMHMMKNTPATEVSLEERVKKVAEEPQEAVSPPSPVLVPQQTAQAPQATPHKKVGRNEPCWCGSGLKYKKCGLINASQHKM